MITLLKKLAFKLGFNKAILFTTSGSLINAFGSIFTIIFIVRFLNGVEQGFYYTFGSLVAIQVFFELGLNGIITQYVAHETSNLKLLNDHSLEGESKYKSRLSSLLHFCVKWYLSFATALFITLIILGFYFFNKYSSNTNQVNWMIPWILLSLGTVMNLILSPIIAFLQGLGEVKEIAKIQMYQQTVRFPFLWGGLIFGAKLYVLSISCYIPLFIAVILIVSKYRILLSNIWSTNIIEKVHYRKEIFPYQWKIAVSWISGYFIFQLFNPVLFATEGPIVAGQMGMTLAALNGIFSLSFAWITTKIPQFSGLIAQKQYSQLDNLFKTNLKQSVFINFSALTFMMIAIFTIRRFNIELVGKPLGNRFLDYFPMLCMMIPVFLNQFTASWASYLRCHKREPFLVNSLVGGVLCSFSTIILGKYFGVIGITNGYCLLTLLMFPWGYNIFSTKKVEWHV